MRTLTRRELNRALLARQLLLERVAAAAARTRSSASAGSRPSTRRRCTSGCGRGCADFEPAALTARARAARGRAGHADARHDPPRLAARLLAVRGRRARGAPRAVAARVEGAGRRRDGRRRARRSRARSTTAPLPRKEVEALIGKPAARGIHLWLDIVRVPPSGTWERRRADLLRRRRRLAPGRARAAGRRRHGPPRPPLPGGVRARLAQGRAELHRPQPHDAQAGARARRHRALPRRGRRASCSTSPARRCPTRTRPRRSRLLPTWDATLLVHARRTGLLPERFRPLIFHTKNPQSTPTFLVDGEVAGTWRLDGERLPRRAVRARAGAPRCARCAPRASGSRRHSADRRRTVPGMPAATPALAHSPLEPQLQKAGATMVARHGWWVAAHFGSPAGELALCETAVGLADRSDLGKLELRGEASAIELLVGQLSGGSVDPGDALLAAGRLVVRGLAGPRARALRRRRDRPRPRRGARRGPLDAGRDGHRRHAALRRARPARPAHRRRARRAQRLRAAARRRRRARLRRAAARRRPGDAAARRAGDRAVVLTEAARAAGAVDRDRARRARGRASATSAPTPCRTSPRSRADERGAEDAERGDRPGQDPRPERAQPQARRVPRRRQRRHAAEGALARPADHRRAARDVRPLVGAPADRAQHGAAAVPDAAQARRAVRDRARPRDEPLRRRGDHRRRAA